MFEFLAEMIRSLHTPEGIGEIIKAGGLIALVQTTRLTGGYDYLRQFTF